MVIEGYQNLISEVNKSLPIYTSHLDTLRKLIEVQTKLSKHFKQIDPEVDLEEFFEIARINKFNALLTISLLDLMVVCKHLCLTEHNWEKFYFIKQGYSIIYETIKAYYKHSSEVQKIIASKCAVLKPTFESITNDLKQFEKLHDYEKVISVVRNKVAGHIEEDFVLYYDVIAKLDGEKVGKTISDFIKILNRLLNLSKDLVSHANTSIQNRSELLNKSLIEKLRQIEEMFAKFEASWSSVNCR